jgi:outer membrane protein OmpA-like peptidoglycan-associated protein
MGFGQLPPRVGTTQTWLCLILLAMPGGRVAAQTPTSAEIVCKLDPSCPRIKMRGTPDFSVRGVKSEGGQEAPSTEAVNIYVNFEYDSAVLQQDAKIILDTLGAALKDSRLSAFSFEVSGHTDAKGTDEYNQRLSEKRAAAVVDYLAGRFGLDRSRVKSRGFGKSQLFDATRPEDGVNRRVQIINTGKVSATRLP